MTHCQHCGTKLFKHAKYCHHCGEAVVLKMETCVGCNTLNPVNSIYCIGCGQSLRKDTHQDSKQEEKIHHEQANNKSDGYLDKASYVYKPIYTVTLSEPTLLQEEIKHHFFKALRLTVNTISHPKKYADYVQVFYDAGFNYYFDQRSQQLSKDLRLIPNLYPNDTDYQIDLLIDNTFESLLDRFTRIHTKELNDWQPPDVSQWELITKEDLDVEKMIYEYLDIPSEDEKHYLNFINVPLPKLKNAHKSFLFAAKSERLLVLSDQTIFGSCKEGYALTNKGIYWKAFFNHPNRFFFEELYDVRKEQDWININGQYFHVNEKMNFKLLKLLKKLRAIYSKPAEN